MTKRQHDPLSTALLTIAIICIFLGLSPQGRGYNDPETREAIIEWSLGLSSSPLWEYRKGQSPDGSFRFESKLHYFSWSSILLVIGAVSLKKRYQLHRKHKQTYS